MISPATGAATGADSETTAGRAALLSLLDPAQRRRERIPFASTRSGLPAWSARETLFAEFAPLVRKLIRQYGDDPEIRKDLNGEIYCRFCALLDAFDPSRGVPLRPYLVRQLTASVYTFARHHWRRQHREVSLQMDTPMNEMATAADPTNDWAHDISVKQVLDSLPDAIARLPRRQRQVVVWRYYEECSFEDIAGRLQVQVATARSLLRHGLNNLRGWIARAQLEL